MSEGHHITPLRVHINTLLALLFLTVFTVWTAKEIHLPGAGNILLAMAIATVKASLVCLFFMGLKYDRKLNVVVFVCGFLFLFFFFLLTFMDLLTRTEITDERGVIPEHRYDGFQ